MGAPGPSTHFGWGVRPSVLKLLVLLWECLSHPDMLARTPEGDKKPRRMAWCAGRCLRRGTGLSNVILSQDLVISL